jgi:hypothetical protein
MSGTSLLGELILKNVGNTHLVLVVSWPQESWFIRKLESHGGNYLMSFKKKISLFLKFINQEQMEMTVY